MTISPLLTTVPSARHRSSRYRDVLTAPYVLRLLAGAVIGHLPVAMAPLALLLAVRGDGGSLQLAGLLAAVYGLCAALGQPLWGRLLDRRGHLLTLALTGIGSTAAFTVLAFLHLAEQPVAATVAAAAAGITTPPLEAALRVLWPQLLHREADRRAGLALDACAQEVVFIVGPVLVLIVNVLGDTTAVLTATAVVGAAGTLLFLTTRPARSYRVTQGDVHWLGAIRAPGIRALATALVGCGIALGSLNVVALAAAEAHRAEYLSTLIPAALAVGSLAGGLLYGRRTWPGTPPSQLLLAAAGILVGLLPMLASPVPPVAIVVALVPGLFLAPLLVMCFHALDDLAPLGTIGESAAWLIACLGLGQAAGTALSGAVGDAGPAAPAAVAVGGAVLACLLLAGARHRLTPSRAVFAH